MKRISIYNNYVKDNPEKRENILNELRKNGFHTTKNGELVIIVGGDGTFLAGIKKRLEQEPVFVVLNAGNLGFFSEFEADDIQKLIHVLKTKEYQIEEIPFYEVHLHGKDEVRVVYFLNEVVVSPKEGNAIHMAVEVDGHLLFKTPADSVIVSGMGGSTAHNAAAGGPISFCDNVLNIAFTNPIMNVAFPFRVYPAIIPDNREIKIFPSTMKQREFKVVYDGHTFHDDDFTFRYITVKRHKKPIKMLRTNQYNRVDKIRNTLLDFSQKNT